MARLLFEIWRDEDGSQAMTQVQRENDELRRKIAPNAIRLHSFEASTVFEAFRLNSEWQGFGPWTPEPNWEDRAFTEEEQQEQQAYLRGRNV